MLHRVFNGVVAKLKLTEVHTVVGGNIARYAFRNTSINKGLLPVYHKSVVSKVAADYHVCFADGLPNGFDVVGLSFKQCNAGLGAEKVWEFRWGAAETIDVYIRMSEKVFGDEAG